MESAEHHLAPFLTQIVLYGQRLEECKSYLSLSHALANVFHGVSLPIAVWDNSVSATKPKVNSQFELVNWMHDPSNSGLVNAYNNGIAIATGMGLRWMLLLDQDTNLTPEFLRSTTDAAQIADSRVAAIVPQILMDGVLRSPVGHTLEYPNDRKPIHMQGVNESLIYAINSGMLINVNFLSQIGGYDRRYGLEFVDLWYCREVYRRNMQIFVHSAVVHHSLSVYSRERFPNLIRYQNILNAQSMFVLSSGSIWTKGFYCWIIVRTIFGNLLNRFGQGYALLDVRHGFEFLFRSRFR